MDKKQVTKLQGTFPIFINQLLHDQIRFADTKAAWVFSTLSVGTGALVTKFTGLPAEYLKEPFPMFSLFITVILITLAFKHVIRVMYPRIAKGNSEGIFYFEDILTKSKDEYLLQGTNLDDPEIISALYEQAHKLSNIASKKFKALRTAIRTTVVAIIVIILVFLVI